MADGFKQRKAIFFVLILALGLRLGWGLTRPNDERTLNTLPDQIEYLQLGRNLVHSGELKFFDARFGQTIYAYRTPGYPAFIAMCAGNVVAIRVVQAVIDASTVAAVYLLAARWLGARGGLIAAVIVAFNPWLIYFSGLVLSETLYTAMLAWGMVLIVHARVQLFGCALLALSALVRPSGIGLSVLLPLSVLLLNRGEHRAYHLPAVGALCLLLILAPWAYRNKQRLGTWIWTTTNAGITQYDGFNPSADGSSNQKVFLDRMPELKQMSEVERNEYLSSRAREYVEKESMRHLIGLTINKIGRMWSPLPLSRQFSNGLYVAVGLLYTVPFFVLVVFGLLSRQGALPSGAKMFLIVPAVYFTVIHALSVGSLRYRMPADAPMAVLAAAAAAVTRRTSPGDRAGSEQ